MEETLKFVAVGAIIVFSLAKSLVNARKRQGMTRIGPPEQRRSGIGAGLLGLASLLKKPDPAIAANQAASAARQQEILASLRTDAVPASMRKRLQGSRDGTAPWIATLNPAELLIARSHGIRPVAAVSATCWLHYGYSWTEGHAQGWQTALRRLKEEAKAAGANAVVDVKMRTIPLGIESSMDFTLVGTAMMIDGLPPSNDPVVATVPALEFVKLLEANIVPTGIAVGAEYEWMRDWAGFTNLGWAGNTESGALSSLWERVRRQAHAQLRTHAAAQGNGVLAHTNFSQMFEQEVNERKQYLARHIVIATTIDRPGDVATRGGQHRASKPLPFDFQMVVDMRDTTPLTGATIHHQSYASNDEEGAI